MPTFTAQTVFDFHDTNRSFFSRHKPYFFHGSNRHVFPARPPSTLHGTRSRQVLRPADPVLGGLGRGRIFAALLRLRPGVSELEMHMGP